MKNCIYKFKHLSFDELLINLDRLTRFKLPEVSYQRVFFDIVTKCLIFPKYTKNELLSLDSKILSNIVENIWNSSIKKLFPNYKYSKSNILKKIILYTYTNFDEYTLNLINTKLVISPLIQGLDYENVPQNLKLLIKIFQNDSNDNILELSKNNKLLFPVRKLVIVEGITEETLLPVFAKKSGFDFDELGIYILGSGGKSKSPNLYSEFKNKLKIPVILLFDSDAIDMYSSLNNILNFKDKIIFIQNGEFEDIISLNLIKRAISREYQLATPLSIQELRIHEKMCDNLKEFYRSRHLGEFKKAKFSKLIAQNVTYKSDISDNIKELINEIVK